MENKQEPYFFNSKLYNKKGQRIACFGRERNGKLEVFELTCSKKDQFSKNYAKAAYHLYFQSKAKLEFHPNIYYCEILSENTPKYQFRIFCETNYFKKSNKLVKFEVEYLYNGREQHILPKTAKSKGL